MTGVGFCVEGVERYESAVGRAKELKGKENSVEELTSATASQSLNCARLLRQTALSVVVLIIYH